MDDFVRLCLDMKIHDNQLKQPSGRTQSGSCVYVGRWDGKRTAKPAIQHHRFMHDNRIPGDFGCWLGRVTNYHIIEISWLSFLSLVQ